MDTEHQTQMSEETNLANLSMEYRRHLCNKARKYVSSPLYFLDHNVEEAQQYQFKYDNTNIFKNDVAIPCPTLPQLFLRHNDTKKQIALVLLPSFLYEVNL